MNMNINGNKNISEIYNRDNVCIFAVLKYLARPEICFIVASCHLLFNTNRGDVKLGQVYQISSTLENLKNIYSNNFQKVNLILCGDFNSMPNSGIYKYLTEGTLDCKKIEKKKISGQGQGSLAYLKPNKLKSSLLQSVCIKFDETKKNNSTNVSI